MSAIVTLHGNIPEGESREFPVAFSGKLMWRIPGISLDRKQKKSGGDGAGSMGGALTLILVRTFWVTRTVMRSQYPCGSDWSSRR